MGIFSILQLVFFVISNLPAMLKAIREIMEIIQSNKNTQVRAAWNGRLKRTMKEYKKHRDPERLGREIKQMRTEFERELG